MGNKINNVTINIDINGSNNLNGQVSVNSELNGTVNSDGNLTSGLVSEISLNGELNTDGNLKSTLSIEEEYKGYLNSFKGDTGLSAFEEWKLIEGNENKNFTDFLNEIGGKESLEMYSYVRTEPTKFNVGGVKSGSTFNGSIIDALDKIFYPLVDPLISLSMSVDDVVENGKVFDSVTLSLELTNNDAEISDFSIYKNNELLITINEIESLNYNFNDNNGVNSDCTYKVIVNYTLGEENKTIQSSKSIKYMNKVYYGSTNLTTINDSFILSLSNSVLSSTKNRTVKTNILDGQYFFYAIPTSYGTPVFSVGGFVGGFEKISTINFTNINGYTESYDVWKTVQNGLGELTINIS